MFNNGIEATNLLSSCYLSGNILFHQDTLYSPVLNYVKQIDLANNRTCILPFQTHNQIHSISLHPSGILLIAIDIVGYAVVFNIKGMFTVAEYNFKGSISSAGFSDDGKLFCVSQAHGFMVYECPSFWRTFEPFILLKKYKNRHSNNICSSKFSPDSRFLVTCGEDNIIYLNNLFPIHGYIAITLEVHRYKILGISFTPDMNYLYTVDTGSNVYVWKWVEENISEGYRNMREAKLRRREQRRGGSGLVRDKVKKQEERGEGEEEAQEGEYHYPEYSAFEQKVTKGKFILQKKLIITQPGTFLKRFTYNPRTGFFAAAYNNGKFSIYKLEEDELTEIQSFNIGEYKISTLCVNETCTWVALGVKSAGQVIVWEWKSQSYIINQKGLVHDSIVVDAVKNGKFLATGTVQGEVKLWEKSSNLCIVTFTQHESSVTDIKFSNPTTLFSCSLDGTVQAYDAVKYRKFRTYRPDVKCQLNSLALDEAGEIVFAGSFDPYEVYGWNVQTGNILQIIRGHEGPISCIALAGERMVTGSWDRTLKIHEIYARKLNVETLDHSSQITALAVHPDGKNIAVATIKGQIYIWELETSNMLGIIQAEVRGGRSYFSKISADNDTNTKYLKTIAYSECGKYILGGGKSKYLYIYDVKHRMLMKKIELTRNRDLQGVVEKLNSKFIKEGQSTYEMMLQEQEKVLEGEDEGHNGVKLPGSKKIDISEIRRKLEVDVKKITMLSSQSFAVCTSFGVFVYSNDLYNKHVFNPYDLAPTMTPAQICTLLTNKQYSSAISAVVSLNLPIRKLLKKIPIQHVKQTLQQLDQGKIEILLLKLAEDVLEYRECIWVENVLRIPGVKVPESLRVAMEGMAQQVGLLRKIEGKLLMAEIMEA